MQIGKQNYGNSHCDAIVGAMNYFGFDQAAAGFPARWGFLNQYERGLVVKAWDRYLSELG